MMPLTHTLKRSPLAGLSLAAALLLLSACNRNADAPASTTTDTPAASPAASPDAGTSPTAPIVPEPSTSPDAKPATSPGEGGTAIGGVVGNQDQGGASGGTPAPTGGDAATTKPADTPSR